VLHYLHTFTSVRFQNTVTYLGVNDYRWAIDWWTNLLTTYKHHSELQVITALSLISTLYKPPQHPLSLFSSRFLVTAFNNGHSSASRAQILSSQSPLQSSIESLPKFSSVYPLCTDRVENTVSNSNSIIVFVFLAAETCLSIRCLETSCLFACCIAMDVHATICFLPSHI
jgi:hypothetical protein